MALYLLDKDLHPYNVWVRDGRPDFPSLELQQQMRLQEVSLTLRVRSTSILISGA